MVTCQTILPGITCLEFINISRSAVWALCAHEEVCHVMYITSTCVLQKGQKGDELHQAS